MVAKCNIGEGLIYEGGAYRNVGFLKPRAGALIEIIWRFPTI